MIIHCVQLLGVGLMVELCQEVLDVANFRSAWEDLKIMLYEALDNIVIGLYIVIDKYAEYCIM